MSKSQRDILWDYDFAKQKVAEAQAVLLTADATLAAASKAAREMLEAMPDTDVMVHQGIAYWIENGLLRSREVRNASDRRPGVPAPAYATINDDPDPHFSENPVMEAGEDF